MAPPSHYTFSKVFEVLDATVFERCFEWIVSVFGVVKGAVAFD